MLELLQTISVPNFEDGIDEKSLLISDLGIRLEPQAAKELRENEIRWHYSQHYLAEKFGEDVIENMLLHSNNKRQRALLTAQLVDENHHAKIFSGEVSRIGMEPRADRYARGYADLVKNQKTFAEKVFVFQILTEAISAAYCEWRLNHIQDEKLNCIDDIVAKDEKRHLLMGKTLLGSCDGEELQIALTPHRQKELIKEMNQLCEKTIKLDMFEVLLGNEFKKSYEDLLDRPTSLDRFVAKTVIQEYRKLKETVLKQSLT